MEDSKIIELLFARNEDGIKHTETRHAGGFGVEIDGHQFLRCNGFEQEQLAFAAYNKATASWQGDWWNEIPHE